METIKSIDLWTEQYENQYECFNGAFVDGFENGKIAFDEYKIVENCNCIITTRNEDINITNKHKAIIFYKEKKPVRLAVINKNTDIDKCIKTALNQYFADGIQFTEYYSPSIAYNGYSRGFKIYTTETYDYVVDYYKELSIDKDKIYKKVHNQ